VFAELLEGFDGAAVLALGLGLITEHERPRVGAVDHAVETVGEGVVAGLLDGDVGLVRQDRVERDVGGDIAVVERVVEGGGEHAGLEARGSEDTELAEGDALDGVHLLVVDGLVAGDGVDGEALELVGGLDTEDGVAGGE
jgi:hypothetical protein